MEALNFTGKNLETHKRLFQMLLFSYLKKLLFHGPLFLGRPVDDTLWLFVNPVSQQFLNSDSSESRYPFISSNVFEPHPTEREIRGCELK